MAGSETRNALRQSDDIVDAEFISIGPSGASVAAHPVVAPSPVQVVPSAATDGMLMLSRSSALAAPVRNPGGPLFWVGGGIVAAAAFWISGGHALLGKPTAEPVMEGASLRIASVISRVDRSGARPLLLVDGKAVNDGSAPVAMPPLHIQIVSAAGGSTLYRLGTAGRSIDSGDFFDFSSRLDLPKDGVKTVFVTFAQ